MTETLGNPAGEAQVASEHTPLTTENSKPDLKTGLETLTSENWKDTIRIELRQTLMLLQEFSAQFSCVHRISTILL